MLACTVMAIRVVEFSNVGYKIRKIFAQKSTYSKVFIKMLRIRLAWASEVFKNHDFKSQLFSSSHKQKIPQIEKNA